MEIKKVKISKIKLNKNNPRRINKHRLEKLKKSLKEFPEMRQIREIVVDENYMILGGNMRLKALKELGEKECYIKIVKGLTEEQKKEFIIKDNVNFGEWDIKEIGKWDLQKIIDYGVPRIKINEIMKNNKYTPKKLAPQYIPRGIAPAIKELYDLTEYRKKISEIKKYKLSKEEKQFLEYAATRFIKFNYETTADYYVNASKEMQAIMEKLALVIIDYDEAVQNGFIQIKKEFEVL